MSKRLNYFQVHKNKPIKRIFPRRLVMNEVFKWKFEFVKGSELHKCVFSN